MTTTFLMVLAIAIAISLSLLFLIIRHIQQENRAEKLRKQFSAVAAAFDFDVSKQDELGNRIIGIDEKSNRLLFFYHTSDKNESYLVELSEIKDSNVIREYVLLNSFNKNWPGIEAAVKRIDLELKYKKGIKPLVLSFFDKTTDARYTMKERAIKARRWQLLLKSRLGKQGQPLRNGLKPGDMYELLNQAS